MNKYLFLVLFAILLSCNNTPAPQEVDFSNTEELQNPKRNSISYSKVRSRDIVGHLYKQAIEKDPKLMTLENEIFNMDEIKKDSLARYMEYVNYNDLYYSSAMRYAGAVQDTVKRKKILSMLNQSNIEYQKGITKQTDAVNSISKLEIDLADQRRIMMLVVSEVLMNSYQMEVPNIESLETINKKYKELINKTSSYTDPK